ncbi:MAG: heme-binding domain-containing protein [Acidobacteriaceae bacterium]|nr:heme-binding domain-containing protein [Acidobacteriaceae bacterium]
MRFFLRHCWTFISGVSVLLAVCSVTVHPYGRPKEIPNGNDSQGDLKLPPEINVLLKHSCMDCHSSRTAWPWYSYVAPVSWLLERDVQHGRDRMNFSEWGRYTPKEQQRFLANIASAVKNGEMPLPQYTFIHRQAKLSDADRNIIYRWARLERRGLRASQLLLPPSPAEHVLTGR